MRKAFVIILILLAIVFSIIPERPVRAGVDNTSDGRPSQSQPTRVEKINPELLARLETLSPQETLTVIVILKEQTALSHISGPDRAARQRGVIQALQATMLKSQGSIRSLLGTRLDQGSVSAYTPFWIFNGLSVTATGKIILELAAHPDVAAIQPDQLDVAPSAPVGAGLPETNLSVIHAPDLWNMGFYGQDIVVANMDTGVDVSHPELASGWRGGSNSWYDPYGEHATPYDMGGHGTWTMGVMVGGDAGGTSIGVAPQAAWVAVKIFNDAGSATATAIHQGYQWLLDPDGNVNTADSPQVVNSSWTFSSPLCDLAFQLDLQSLRAAGILPVFSAGNFGPSSASSASPANYPEAFAVGAVDNADQIGSFSSRGPSQCGESPVIYPEIVAPGVGIHTTDLYGLYADESGTSLAAPHAVGALALLLNAFPNLTAAQQEVALINGALDLGTAGPDNDYGNGRLDVLGAYQWLVDNGFVPASIITVTTTQDVIADDGQCSLREAVIAANTDSAFHDCPAGNGVDTINLDPDLVLPAVFNLSLSGANEDQAQTGDLDIHESLIINGLGSSDTILDGNLTDRVFEIHPGAGTNQNPVILNDLTIRDGNPGASAEGGGILVDATARLTINNSQVTSNTATGCAGNCGGGVKVYGLLTINDSSVANNQGGGVHNQAGLLYFSNVDVTNNTGGYGVVNQDGANLSYTGGTVSGNQGGGIYNKDSSAPTLTNLTVSENTTGGGIHNESSAPVNPSSITLTDSTVISNTATSGAGILNSGVSASATVQDSRIGGNIATSGGGGINNNGNLTLSGSTLDRNQARSGGGIDHHGSSLQLTNNTISLNNASDNGGGLYIRTAATLLNSTVYGNSASGPDTGGNLYVDGDTASVAVKNTIIANAGAGGNCFNNQGAIHSQGHNLESSNTCELNAAGDIINAVPLLGPLGLNGGNTFTHALLAGSPAINAGDNNGCPATDQRGVFRPQGAVCDIGAYERILDGEADLAVNKTDAADPVAVGDAITYNLTVSNNGPDAAQNVVLTDNLPGTTTYLSATPDQGSCDHVSGVVTCNLGDIPNTGAIDIQIVTSSTVPGVVTNNASVTSDTVDPKPGNNSASEDTTVHIQFFLPIVMAE